MRLCLKSPEGGRHVQQVETLKILVFKYFLFIPLSTPTPLNVVTELHLVRDKDTGLDTSVSHNKLMLSYFCHFQ